MNRIARRVVAGAIAVALPHAGMTASPPAPRPPTRVGTCVLTTVREVTQRLQDSNHRVVPNSGSAIILANGVYSVSYDQVEAVNRSRVGDRAMTCLVRLPQHCPPGDERGIIYTTTNLRTEEPWTLPDAEHQCGGA